MKYARYAKLAANTKTVNTFFVMCTSSHLSDGVVQRFVLAAV